MQCSGISKRKSYLASQKVFLSHQSKLYTPHQSLMEVRLQKSLQIGVHQQLMEWQREMSLNTPPLLCAVPTRR
uniref:Uncharacterized protein n=1 Tax=Brassica oleracea TaxID=3712 RepID=A0A3P6EBK7_BRAOL|nr:unnamed protein product [Brassica oleracea]